MRWFCQMRLGAAALQTVLSLILRSGAYAALLAGLCAATNAQARRVALAVGVGDYSYFNDLTLGPDDPSSTPARDARAFAAAIERRGFETTVVTEASTADMRAALTTFLQSLEPDDEALFFFSGHGAQKDGVNYLFAADSRVDAASTLTELTAGAVNVTALLRDMQARARVALMFLDACSTELPGSKSGHAKGLTFVDASEVMARGAFIGLASQENTPSFTGDGELSYYTAALVDVINDSRAASDVLERLHDDAARRVRDASFGQQSPTYRNNFGLMEYRLAPEAPAPPAPAPDPTPPSPDPVEAVYWAKCDSGGAAYCDAYLATYPGGVFAPLAQLRTAELTAAAPVALTPDTPLQPSNTAPNDLSGAPVSLPDAQTDCVAVTVRAGCHCAVDPLLKRAREFCPPGLHRAASEPQELRSAALLQTQNPQMRTRDASQPQTFRDCAACPLMTRVPGGSFMMGAGPSDRGARPSERPRHSRTLAPFAVAAFEATFAEYDACVAAGGCAERPSDNGHGRADRPVINVSWNDAAAYIDWLNAQTGGGYRLLSEAEWEYAARAGSTTPYPWGRLWTRARAPFRPGDSAVVPPRRRNAFGLGGMIGGVAEWVADCWRDDHSGAASLADGGAPHLGVCADNRVVRGGSWRSRPRDLRAAARDQAAPDTRRVDLGFRVGKTEAPE